MESEKNERSMNDGDYNEWQMVDEGQEEKRALRKSSRTWPFTGGIWRSSSYRYACCRRLHAPTAPPRGTLF